MLENPEKEGFRLRTPDYGRFSRFDEPVIFPKGDSFSST
jgi:hypothetical protein